VECHRSARLCLRANNRAWRYEHHRSAGQRGPDPRRNAGGRPKAELEVIALAREQTTNAIKRLVQIMNDEAAPAGARVRAAEVILERGWGRPSQDVRLHGDVVHHVKRIIIEER
jgi:hypothetical protein